MQQMYADVDAVNDEIKAQGAWVFAGGLHPANTATTVRVAATARCCSTDGPFAETKEQLGGFWVIEAADLDAALAWAAKATVACQAPVEVRPFQDEPRRSAPCPTRLPATVERVFRRGVRPGGRDPGPPLRRYRHRRGGGPGRVRRGGARAGRPRASRRTRAAGS